MASVLCRWHKLNVFLTSMAFVLRHWQKPNVVLILIASVLRHWQKLKVSLMFTAAALRRRVRSGHTLDGNQTLSDKFFGTPNACSSPKFPPAP